MNTNLEQLGQLGIELAKRVGAHIPDFNDPEIQKLCRKILEGNKDIRNEFSIADFTIGAELAETNEMDAKHPGWNEYI